MSGTSDPTLRFSDRVADYARYRPSYPEAFLDWFQERVPVETVVADVGSGTGILTRQLLKRGYRVWAVEPNRAMREAAREALRGCRGFRMSGGRAEATGLPPASVGAVVAAQAFHWFEAPAARLEFQRILVEGGTVCLVWNSRVLQGPFAKAYEAHLKLHGIEYARIRHHGVGPAGLEAFFGHRSLDTASFPNRQVLGWEGFLGRHRSSSYTPPEGHPGAAADRAGVERLFEAFAEGGHVVLHYRTRAWWGPLVSRAGPSRSATTPR